MDSIRRQPLARSVRKLISRISSGPLAQLDYVMMEVFLLARIRRVCALRAKV